MVLFDEVNQLLWKVMLFGQLRENGAGLLEKLNGFLGFPQCFDYRGQSQVGVYTLLGIGWLILHVGKDRPVMGLSQLKKVCPR